MSDQRKKTEYPSMAESRRVLKNSSPEDFDGHTSFADMSAEERIRWASISAMSVYKAKEWQLRERR